MAWEVASDTSADVQGRVRVFFTVKLPTVQKSPSLHQFVMLLSPVNSGAHPFADVAFDAELCATHWLYVRHCAPMPEFLHARPGMHSYAEEQDAYEFRDAVVDDEHGVHGFSSVRYRHSAMYGSSLAGVGDGVSGANVAPVQVNE